MTAAERPITRYRVVTQRRHLRRIPLAVALCAALLACLPALAAADTGDPLVYYGGPVSHGMTADIVEWGPSINSIYTNPTTGDPGLFKYFASQDGSTTDSGAILAQYMDTTGHNAANQVTYGGEYQITPSISATTLQDAQVGAQLVQSIESGALPTPSGNGLADDYLVLFPAGTTVCSKSGCSGQAFCSYHSSAQLPNGTNVIYDVLPDNTSGAMTEGCGDQATPLQDQTMYLSHEWAESIDDPLVENVTTMGPPLAWYDANCPTASSMCGEVADKCNQETAVEGGWTVQLLWSNLDAACMADEPKYAEPNVSFSAPLLAAPGEPLTFAGSATDPSQDTTSATYNGTNYSIPSGITGYSWSWGDGSTGASTAGATHSFSSPGIYSVTLTATDAMGFSGSVTHLVAVWGPLGAPTATTGAASAVKSATAIVTGSLDPVGLLVGSRFDYGLSAQSLTSSTPVVPGAIATLLTKPVSAHLTGLAPDTTYYYRLDAVIGGQALPGSIVSFHTLPAVPAQHPKVTTGRATRVGPTSVHLAGSIDPAGSSAVTYRFAYGSGAGFARLARASSARTLSGSRSRRIATTLRGLRPGTSYSYAVIATLDGHTYTGSTHRFRTAARAARDEHTAFAEAAASNLSATVVPGQPLARALARGLLVRIRCGGPCRARLFATLYLKASVAAISVPRVLASATVRIGADGAGLARLAFSSSAREWLATLRTAQFAVSGFSEN